MFRSRPAGPNRRLRSQFTQSRRRQTHQRSSLRTRKLDRQQVTNSDQETMTESKSQPSQSALLEALVRLETQVATPVIAGEEKAWLSVVQKSLGDVERELRPAISRTHAAQFAEMRDADAALGAQIETLKSADQASLEQLDELLRKLAKLQGKLATEVNESLLKEDFDTFVDLGLAFVVAVRKQETAIQTWFSEAFLRDVGPVD
jgi:hypothetical protein